MSALTILGLVAGTLSTFAVAPQAIKTWRTRSTEDLSLATLLIAVLCGTLWSIYAILLPDWPLLVANVIGLGFQGTILYYKLGHDGLSSPLPSQAKQPNES